jgi:hypothetical protein
MAAALKFAQGGAVVSEKAADDLQEVCISLLHTTCLHCVLQQY